MIWIKESKRFRSLDAVVPSTTASLAGLAGVVVGDRRAFAGTDASRSRGMQVGGRYPLEGSPHLSAITRISSPLRSGAYGKIVVGGTVRPGACALRSLCRTPSLLEEELYPSHAIAFSQKNLLWRSLTSTVIWSIMMGFGSDQSNKQIGPILRPGRSCYVLAFRSLSCTRSCCHTCRTSRRCRSAPW